MTAPKSKQGQEETAPKSKQDQEEPKRGRPKKVRMAKRNLNRTAEKLSRTNQTKVNRKTPMAMTMLVAAMTAVTVDEDGDDE